MMASATFQYPQGQGPTMTQAQGTERRQRDSRKRLHDLSNTRKSRQSTSTQDVGGSFRVNNISGNGMIHFRPVKRELQNNANEQTTQTHSPGSGSRPSLAPVHEQPRQASFESGTGTWRESRSSPKPQSSHSFLLSAYQDQDKVGASNEQLKSRRQQSSSVHDSQGENRSQSNTSYAGKSRLVAKHAKSTGTLSTRSDRAKAASDASLALSPGSATGQMGLSAVSSAARTQPTSPSTARTHDRPSIHNVRPSNTLTLPPKAPQKDILQSPSVQRLAQRKTVSSDTLSCDNDSEARIHASRLSRALDNSINRANIRFSPTSGQVLAASPTQLILQITSPNLLDYELLSDFFLTFRVFLTPQELAIRLVERLRWAVNSLQESARIVRVRTFVAMRHWVLNYFVDDFVADFDLRCQFCNLVNGLCNELRHSHIETGGNLKILGELKKCWRRTCALYWDVPTHPFVESGEVDIQPGGVIGSRKPDPSAVSTRTSQHFDEFSVQTPLRREVRSSLEDRISSVGHKFFKFATDQLQPVTTQSTNIPRQQSNAQRESEESAHVISCSMPTGVLTDAAKSLTRFESTAAVGTPHGRPRASQLPPSSFKGKRHQHKRSGSFSDALRDDRAPLSTPKPKPTDAQLVSAMSVPGSLIRGAYLLPTAPYVDTVAPSSPLDESSSFDFGAIDEQGENTSDESDSPVSTPGVRRFFGSVRRAWSTRQSNPLLLAEKTGSFDVEHSPTGVAMSSGRAPSRRGHGAPKRKLVAGRIQPRVDFLSADTSNAFAKAVHDAENMRRQPASVTLEQPAIDQNQSKMYLDPNAQSTRANDLPRTHSGVSTGSRSIMIMDDTGTHNSPEIGQGGFEEPDTSTAPLAEPEMPAPASQIMSSPHHEPKSLDSRHPEPDISRLGIPIDNALNSTLQVESSSRPTKSRSFSNFSERLGENTANATEGLNVTGTVSEQRIFAGTSALSDASDDSTENPFSLERTPKKHLKRRPGGDLRRADRVDDLHDDLRGDSMSSEHFEQLHLTRASKRASSAKINQSPYKAAAIPKPSDAAESTMDSHTSKIYFRPSIELAAAKLAELPDDPDQDGIASALSRLEGRDQTADTPMFSFDPTLMASVPPPPRNPEEALAALTGENTKQQHREDEVVQKVHVESPKSRIRHDPNGISQQPSRSRPQPEILVEAKPVSMTESEATDHSVPLLQRGVSLPTEHNKVLSQHSRAAVGSAKRPKQNPLSKVDASTSGLSPKPAPVNARGSFLLDDNESLSSLSSVTTDGFSDDQESLKEVSHPETMDTNKEEARIERNFSQSGFDFFGHQPSPTDGVQTSENTLLSRGGAGTSDLEEKKRLADHSPSWFEGSIPRRSKPPAPVAIHLPFILGYDSLLLAQQFTLIEKDALSEIEWRDLIEIRWKQSSTFERNWVDSLKSNASTQSGQPVRGGIDLCIARFNLMSRWVLSEIVLTQDIAERAACIVKFIHIAQHTRRLRNWATMYQITMALVRSDCSRLRNTWALVPDAECDVLRVLEKLIMPTRNFHFLRAEMESVTSDGETVSEGGCIPFIGIYTHDLVYNASKRTFLQAEDGAGDSAEKLVNFDRCHTAAAIVKNLLRLIEASSRYTFQPVPEVASRCLWTAALSDEEISARSRELES